MSEAPPQDRPDPVPSPRPSVCRSSRTDRRGVAAIVLVVLGLVLWLGSWLLAGSEQHVFGRGTTPPSEVTLTAGTTYGLAVPDGINRADFPPILRCSLTPAGGEPATLDVRDEADGSRAQNRIGSFVAPTSGRAAVSCSGLPPVFVDDADDASADYSGLLLVLACIALAVGLPLLLSSLRAATTTAGRSAS